MSGGDDFISQPRLQGSNNSVWLRSQLLYCFVLNPAPALSVLSISNNRFLQNRIVGGCTRIGLQFASFVAYDPRHAILNHIFGFIS